MTERSRAFLAELERRAGLPPDVLTDEFLPGFAADDPRLDDITDAELEVFAGLFLGALARADYQPFEPFAAEPVRRAIVLAGQSIATGSGLTISPGTAGVIHDICPYCPDDGFLGGSGGLGGTGGNTGGGMGGMTPLTGGAGAGSG